MFSKESFGKCEAQEKLASVLGRYVFKEGSTVDEVRTTIDKAMFDIQIYQDAPAYVMSKAIYDNEGAVTSARFVLRPSSRAELAIDDCRKTFVVDASADFYDRVIKEVAVWFDTYNEHAKLQANIDELNAVVEGIRAERELATKVSFSLGKGILDIGNDYVVVGLSADKIMDISEMAVFSSMLETRIENSKNIIADTIIECVRPYDIVKIKNVFTKDLGIYERRSIVTLLREIINRKIDHVRTGIGYYSDDTTFAVIEKVAITEDTEVAEGTLVIDNTKMSSAEGKKNLTKIAVTYKVAPFNKETLEPVELDLATVIA